MWQLTRTRRTRPAQNLLLLVALLSAAVLLLAACGDDAEAPAPDPTAPPATPEATATSEPAPTPTETPSPTPTPAPAAEPSGEFESIEEIDFADPDFTGPILDYFGGGAVEPERVVFTDMTGDGELDAVIIVESGGTMGDIGVAVFELVDGQPEAVQFIEATGRIDVRFDDIDLGLIVVLEPVFEPGDPQCCPSSLHETVYRWDDQQFSTVTEQVIDAAEALNGLDG